MQRLMPCLVCVGSLIWLVQPPCSADDSRRSAESVLAKWEQASQNCRILDAKLKVFRYDVFSGQRPEILEGRFYWEAPNVARYEIAEAAKGGTRGPSGREVLVWSGGTTLWIDGTARRCYRFSSAGLQTLQDWLGDTVFAGLVLALQSPEECLPLVTNVRAADVQRRFEVAVADDHAGILLRLTPKLRPDKRRYREIAVILDPETHMTSAIALVAPNGTDRTVFELLEQKVNHPATDRGELIEPDLSGLDVTGNP